MEPALPAADAAFWITAAAILGLLVLSAFFSGSETALTAVPYYAWCNRGANAMQLWLRE